MLNKKRFFAVFLLAVIAVMMFMVARPHPEDVQAIKPHTDTAHQRPVDGPQATIDDKAN